MHDRLALLVRRDGGRLSLLAPEVGLFTCAAATGTRLSSGQRAGVLLALGRTIDLVVPAGVGGAIVSPAPERVHAPVGYGDVLYELEPLAQELAGAPTREPTAAADRSGTLALRSTQSGRFYHRPAPGEPVFAAVGAIVADGQPVGLIEVMKTFTHVLYRAGGALPARARVVRFVASDGSDVRQGEPLIEVEAAIEVEPAGQA